MEFVRTYYFIPVGETETQQRYKCMQTWIREHAHKLRTYLVKKNVHEKIVFPYATTGI